MKKIILTTMVTVGLSLASISSAWAEDKTIQGTASCAEGHETVIKVKEGSKTVTYHLAKNEKGKEFHGKVCRESAKVKATGEVKEVDGQMVLMAKNIEVVNEK